MTQDNGEIVIGGDATDIPPGTYPGKLDNIETRTSVAYGDFRRWQFTLDNGSVVSGASSMATGSKSKGGKWIAALLGRKPDKGTTVNVIGRPCLVVVGLKDDWPEVTDVLPPLAAPHDHSGVETLVNAIAGTPQTPQDAPGRAELP